MIYLEINFNMFKAAFSNMEREENFSSNGLKALYNFLEDCGEETETNIELDVIALCCTYEEYRSKDHLLDALRHLDIDTIEQVEEHTVVIPVYYDDNTTGYIIQRF